MTACATGHGAENPPTVLRSASSAATCAEIKFYGVFVLNHRVVLHAIDAAPARWRGDAGSSPLNGVITVHPTHWLISTQAPANARSADVDRRVAGGL